MNQYRKNFDKLYNKINKLAQKGSDYIYEYFSLIDETVSLGQYSLLEDVMKVKYGITLRNFLSVNDFKENSFEIVRSLTNDLSAVNLQKLLDQKSVYQVGFYIYDKITNQYLGDVKELETQIGKRFTNTKLINLTIDLQAERGIQSSIYSAIPTFENNPLYTRRYIVGDLLLYQGTIYQCQLAYTYSSTNRLTPTFSAYWAQMITPTYSAAFFTSSSISLAQKYSSAIDFLRGYTYSNLSANSFVEEDYVDDYVE